jgi:hypothetical protein
VVGEGRGEEGGGVRGSEAPKRSTRGDQAAVCVHIENSCARPGVTFVTEVSLRLCTPRLIAGSSHQAIGAPVPSEPRPHRANPLSPLTPTA